jgi:hypothetical protein
MKAVVWHGRRDVRVEAVADPTIQDVSPEPPRRAWFRRSLEGVSVQHDEERGRLLDHVADDHLLAAEKAA